MERFINSLPSIPVVASIFLFIVSILLWRSTRFGRHSGPRAVGGAWPIIGHLHLFSGPGPIHRVLGSLADQYGPIFTIRMGRAHQKAIVVSKWEIAKECLTTNDKAFIARRPHTIATETLGYNYSVFGFTPYGHYWRQMRKLVTIELLSSHRLRLLKPVRESEIRLATRELYDLWRQARKGGKNDTVSVEMMGWFGDVALNGILRVVFGKRVGYYTSRDEESAKLKKLVRDYFDSVEKFGVGDVFPWLRRFDIGGHEESLKRIAKDLDDVVHEWLREHKESRCDGGGTTEKLDGDDFMGVLLSILDEYGAERHDADAVNKATCVGLVLGASDSSTVVMSWALSLLMNHPEALKKAQIELEDLVGMERQVQESDLPNLHYLQAVVKETFRLYPPVPVNMRGPSGEDCVVAGRHIPKGTQLVLNYFKLQRDPHVWVEPNEFRPERFLTTTHKNVDVKGQDFELLPFGAGRRMCPGVSFALHVVQLTLATLLQGFDFRTTTFSGAKVDMGEAMGSTYQRASPLEVLLSPRLPSHLYG
ncbi:unnamed protein product [Linum tenue]|uniref:Uncharacterized protein n=1 Tax=Linum tenue TaxID=586396 RepID=A0AAV0RM31_9ROSI|nr:unnamed protein product [Linum tenue]